MHNIPMDPAVGIDDTIAFIDDFFAMCESMVIETLHLAVCDNVVLTERQDHHMNRPSLWRQEALPGPK